MKEIPDFTYVSGRNYDEGIQISSMEAAASMLKRYPISDMGSAASLLVLIFY